MFMQPIVRVEVPVDVPSIEAVTVAAFLNAAHSSHTEQHIVNALRRSGALTVSLVAELDGVLVGHIALSPVSISDGSTHWFGLGPISVLPAHQGHGVGSALMQAALVALRQHGAHGCVLLGDPGYYGRFGFRATPDLVLPGVPPEYFQALHLGTATARGSVTYHPAFDATS
jgi:putative acetyltransferase